MHIKKTISILVLQKCHEILTRFLCLPLCVFYCYNVESDRGEMDLGVIMHKSAKPLRQCVEAEKQPNSTVVAILRKIVNRVKDKIC